MGGRSPGTGGAGGATTDARGIGLAQLTSTVQSRLEEHCCNICSRVIYSAVKAQVLRYIVDEG